MSHSHRNHLTHLWKWSWKTSACTNPRLLPRCCCYSFRVYPARPRRPWTSCGTPKCLSSATPSSWYWGTRPAWYPDRPTSARCCSGSSGRCWRWWLWKRAPWWTSYWSTGHSAIGWRASSGASAACPRPGKPPTEGWPPCCWHGSRRRWTPSAPWLAEREVCRPSWCVLTAVAQFQRRGGGGGVRRSSTRWMPGEPRLFTEQHSPLPPCDFSRRERPEVCRRPMGEYMHYLVHRERGILGRNEWDYSKIFV